MPLRSNAKSHSSADSGQYDAIIVGGGHNGLVTANYLARSGKNVLVLEKRDVIGGAAVTEEPWAEHPGVKVSTASYTCSLLDPEIINDLSLKDFGFKFIVKNPQSFTPMLDGNHLFIYSDMEATQREIARFSKKDAEAYPKYDAYISRIGAFLEPTLKQSPPEVEDLFSLANLKFGIKNRRLIRGVGDISRDAIDIFSLSVRDLLDRWFESEVLKATLTNDGIVGANASPSTPGTAYVLLHHVIGGTESGSWGFVEGGMGAISLALQRSAERYGVTVQKGVTVEKIIVENGRATGVATLDGRVYHSNLVVSDADPKVTFLKLVDEKELPEDFVRRVQGYLTSASSFKLNLLLEGLPEYTCYNPEGGKLGPQHRGSTYIEADNYEMMERAFDDAKYGLPSKRPFVSLTIPSSVDKTLAPEGMYVAGCFVQYAPLELKGTTWAEEKPKFEERIIDTIEQYAPNIRKILVAKQGLSPLDLQETFSLTGGNIMHGDLSLNQLFSFRFSYKTPIENLWMCGAGTHPGGGVSGLPGLNAAKEILRA